MPVEAPPQEIVYPESDGEPIAENTLQFRWIVKIQGGFDALFRDDPNVFVAGDLLWYPVEGDNKTRLAPDAMVAFGRPKGDRGSYRQWDEGGVAPQVVFEVLSPGNRAGEMRKKFEFYERFGVEEYYVYDPDIDRLEGWLRAEDELTPIDDLDGWVSPRLGITFRPEGTGLEIYGPDGDRFQTFVELAIKADEAQNRADAERRRVLALEEKLRLLGVDPDGE